MAWRRSEIWRAWSLKALKDDMPPMTRGCALQMGCRPTSVAARPQLLRQGSAWVSVPRPSCCCCWLLVIVELGESWRSGRVLRRATHPASSADCPCIHADAYEIFEVSVRLFATPFAQTHKILGEAPTSAVRQVSRASSSPLELASRWRIGGELHLNAVMEKKNGETRHPCDV